MPKSSLLERFVQKFIPEPNTGCWLWTACCSSGGYGSIKLNGKMVGAHRVAYELFVGPIPYGLELDHVKARGCVGSVCVNPQHLEPVTHQENTRRGEVGSHNRDKTRCPAGHLYDEANTFESSHPGRRCRECHRERNRARYRR